MNIREKLLQVQSELNAPKNKRNTFGNYNYRSAEDILEAVKPLLKKHGLTQTISDEIMAIGERVYVKAMVTVYDTESEETMTAHAYAREALTKKGMDDSQITGSTSSYARKYALNGMYSIDDTQDADGMDNRDKPVSKPTTKTPPKSKPSTKKEEKPKEEELLLSRDMVFAEAYQKGVDKAEVMNLWKQMYGAKADSKNQEQIQTMLDEIDKIDEFAGTPLE